MKRLLLVLLMCAPAWGVNLFTGDPNCVGLWTGDSTSDSIYFLDESGNSNHLNGTGAYFSASSAQYKEGSYSMRNTNDWYVIERPNATLSAKFPGKSGTTNRNVSTCCWIYGNINVVAYDWLLAVYDFTGNKQSWSVYIDASGNVNFGIGYNGGASFESYANTGVALGDTKWYHIGTSYNGTTGAVIIRVWDDTGSTVYNATTTFSETMNIEDAGFALFGYTTQSNSGHGYEGYMDEVVVFNDVLTTDEIDQIRLGTYGATAETGTSDWWWRRRHNN